MKTKLVTLILGAATFAGAGAVGAADSTSSSRTVSIPTTPAPTIAAPAPAVAPAPTPNQIVYTPRLPSPAELTNAATAQGLSVERLEQTATQILAVYRNSAGQLNTVAYQILPPAGVATPSSGAPAPVVAVTSQQPTVVYDTAPRVVYYDSYDPFYYPSYYPRGYYPPVSVRLGFGFGSHGGFRGGFHHWR